MRVKLLISRSGPAGSFDVGDEIEVSSEEGQRLIDAGKAHLVSFKKPKREKATVKPEETRGRKNGTV